MHFSPAPCFKGIIKERYARSHHYIRKLVFSVFLNVAKSQFFMRPAI